MTGVAKLLSKLSFGTLLLLVGCDHQRGGSSLDSDRPAEANMLTTKETIEASAISEVTKRTSLKPNQLKVETRQDGQDWRVTVIRLPETPGAFYTVVLSDKGEVKEFSGGE